MLVKLTEVLMKMLNSATLTTPMVSQYVNINRAKCPSEAVESPCHFYVIPVQNVPTDADICHKVAGILIKRSVSE